MKNIASMALFLLSGSLAVGMAWLATSIIRRGGIGGVGVPDAIVVPIIGVILFSALALLALFAPSLDEQDAWWNRVGEYAGREAWRHLPWPLGIIPRQVRRDALSRASRRQRALYRALQVGPHVVLAGSFLVLFAGARYSLAEPLRTVEHVMHWVMTNSALFFFVCLVITPCQVIRRAMIRRLVEADVPGDKQAQRRPG